MDAAARPGDHGAVASLDAVSRRFDETVALDDVSLDVMPGTILGIIGPSGAGKTTAIRLLTGGLVPSSGSVRVFGRDPQRFDRRLRERIGYMPQAFTLYADLTARENVDFVASLFGMLFRSRARRTREVLELVDLWQVRGRRAGRLSGGMQRRLELACALVHEPDLLFLDEPTAGVDPLLRGRIWEELHRLRDAGRTLLVTTQYLNETEECDRVALIAEGRLVALATPDELRREAVGGDIVVIETKDPPNLATIAGLAGVRDVRFAGQTTMSVVVDAADEATPAIVEAITAAGGEVVAAREERASFDEVFAMLVRRARSTEGAAA